MNTTLLLHDAYIPSEIADALSDALFILSSQKEIRACNARAKDLLHAAGAGRRKLIDLFFSELSLGDVFFKKNATPIQNRKIGIGEGTYVVRALFSGQRLVLILADLTDLRNMAQDISSYLGELSRFRMACNFLPGGIVVADPFDRIVFMNTAMREKLLARGERAEQILLSDLERIFGQFPTGEEALVLSSPALTGAPLLVEKRPLLLNGKLHGILLRFSEGGEPARSPARMAKSASVSGGDLFLPHKHDSAPATKPGRTGLSYSLANFVGQGKTVLHLKDVIRKVAASSSTVLLQSESGTGKELLAHSLHELSERANGPFIKLNCASLPESLLEAEVFGYDSGAFTGAKKSGNPGLFEQAHTGTIFLDEIGEMSLPLQAKLLRIIQEKEVQRLGGKDSKRLDVRVVCATNRNLMEFVEQGKFRSDLLFRLNVVSIAIPPLRDRKEDIKSLIIHYLREYSLHFKKRVSGVSKDVYFLFMHYEWPGNVRELGNILEYAFNIIDGATVEMKHLPQYIFESKKLSGNLSGRLEALVGEYSAQVIKKTLEQYNGNKAAAAGALGISRSKLYRLLADN